jgi:UDP-N-acetyl-D-mannosaminuronate dehydrogenase
VLGLEYRGGTGIDRDSQAVEIVRRLAAEGPVAVYDPQIGRSRSSLGNELPIVWCQSLEECLAVSEKLVVAAENEEFRRHNPQSFFPHIRFLLSPNFRGGERLAIDRYG